MASACDYWALQLKQLTGSELRGARHRSTGEENRCWHKHWKHVEHAARLLSKPVKQYHMSILVFFATNCIKFLKTSKLIGPKGLTMMPTSGLDINLWPCVMMIVDLLTWKSGR